MSLLFSKQLPIGWGAVDFSLEDTQGKFYSLKDFIDKKGLLIVFTCNHCPYALAAWPLLIGLYKKYNKKIHIIAINPNDHILYSDDSFEQMRKKKIEWKIPFPYLRDETQEVAKKYQAQCTPDPYLFINEQGTYKLFYHGRINDNWQNPKLVKEHNLREAIKLLITEKTPPNHQQPSLGCSIKWKE